MLERPFPGHVPWPALPSRCSLRHTDGRRWHGDGRLFCRSVILLGLGATQRERQNHRLKSPVYATPDQAEERPERPERPRLERGIQRIAAQLRKLESITSAYSQIAGYGFPEKSTPAGLAAMNDLENLVNGDVELDNKDRELLVASLQHDKSEFGKIVIDTLEILRGQKEAPENFDEGVTRKIADLLDRQKGAQEDSKATWPLPPSESDSAPNAQNARWPILAALEQTCQDGRRALGLAEAQLDMTGQTGQTGQQKKLKKKRLLDVRTLLMADEYKLFGLRDTHITGVVDTMDRAISGDLLLLEIDDIEPEDVARMLEEAKSRQVSAVFFLSDTMDFEELDKELASCSEPFIKASASLKTVAFMPKTTKRQKSLSLHFVQSFFGLRKMTAKTIAVMGANDLEVRSAAWLLFKLLEAHAGASKTGFINDRCSLLAQSNLRIFGTLTPCTVQEILAGMQELQVAFCVAEVLSSSCAFDQVQFDLVLDLGGGPKISAGQVIRPQDQPIPKEQKKKLKASYSYEAPKAEDLEQFSALTKGELIEELTRRGVEEVSTSASKKELVEELMAIVLSDSPEEPPAAPSPQDVSSKNLHAKFTSTSIEGLELQLVGLGMVETLTLPDLGLCSQSAVTAAICAAVKVIQDDGGNRQFLAAMPSIPPPPGTLELFQAESSTGILHEASSPHEVREALKALQEALHPKESKKPKLTVVFGCDGEVSRGDRAKFAWALAEHCDRIVLTSASPGVEPPMQIIEDILEAIRGFRTWNKMKTPLDVFAIADRADAIKLGTMISDGPADSTLVFGSGYSDSYEATDESGQVCSWLFHDRRLLTEALQLAEDVKVEKAKLPWLRPPGKRFLLPGRSLHWSYGIEIVSNGQLLEFL